MPVQAILQLVQKKKPNCQSPHNRARIHRSGKQHVLFIMNFVNRILKFPINPKEIDKEMYVFSI